MNRLIVGILLIFESSSLCAQIPEKAIHIADSVCKTRMICPNMSIQFLDSIYYPKEITKYQNREHESYFFQYDVFFNGDLKYDLNVLINEDLSIKFISGFPDSTYPFSPCDILPRYDLWKIARENGLRTKFDVCIYTLWFGEDGIYIKFHVAKSRWDEDSYRINAITGEFMEHRRANVHF